ncbi:MAG: carboxypeptidase regulatory-like domain-containing protein [SAR324 cluster bacterium]|nr:carboxypeptidase regulatory-like domain-containing protein [SAR324 cluster bacterium]
MSLQDSPSLEDFSEGYSPPPDPEKRKKRSRIFLVIASLLVLLLVVVNFLQSDLAANLSQKGSVSGRAVNESGVPIQVEVLLFGTDIHVLSDENGFFIVENVPVGEHSVIVAYGNIATEVKLRVELGSENRLGMVTVPTDLLVFVDE